MDWHLVLSSGALAFSASMAFLSSLNHVRSTSIYSSFLRCFRRLVCVAVSSLSRRGKEPDRPSMNQGAVK